MNTLKLFTLPITILVSFILLLLIIHLVLKPFKARLDEEGKLKLSYGIWFASLFLSGANIITSIIRVGQEAADNIYKMQPKQMLVILIKSISSVVGLGFLWLLIWFFAVKFLTRIIVFKGNDEQEMSANNYGYFIVKGVILLGVVFSLSSILELVLRIAVPTIEIPFYH